MDALLRVPSSIIKIEDRELTGQSIMNSLETLVCQGLSKVVAALLHRSG